MTHDDAPTRLPTLGTVPTAVSTAVPIPESITVSWTDPRAVELRRRMHLEMVARYSSPPLRPPTGDIAAALAVDPADLIATVLLLDPDGTAVAHGTLQRKGGEVEVKRVFVDAGQRGRGTGRMLMAELERIALDAGVRRLILQTGDRQPEAVSLYESLGYAPIPIYEPYVKAIPFSLCFAKQLVPPQ